MSTVSNRTFKEFFLGLPGRDAGNEAMEKFSQALAITTGVDDDTNLAAKVKDLADDVDAIFFVGTADKKVDAIHSVVDFGGTLTRPTHKFGALCGFGAEALRVLVDLGSAVKNCSIRTPTPADLKACSDAAAVAALTRGGNVTFKGSMAFRPAPWLWEKFLESAEEGPVDPCEFIVIAFAAAAEHDAGKGIEDAGEQPLDDDPKSATNHAGAFAMWAWGVHAETVKPTNLLIRAADTELKRHSDYRHLTCLAGHHPTSLALGTGGVEEGVLEQLAENLSTQSEALKSMTDLHKKEYARREATDEAKKDRTKDLHHTIKHMLLVASTSSVEVATRTELVKTCKDFLNQKTVGAAEMELAHGFAKMRMSDVTFAQGTTMALYHGSFLYKSPGAPCNFSGFSFYQKNQQGGTGKGEDLNDRAILLHMMAEHGKGKSYEEVKSMTKQTVVVPMTIYALHRQILFLGGASELFFGNASSLTENLTLFAASIMDHLERLNAQTAVDPSFPAKVLYAVDMRTQDWLLKCMKAKSRDEVSDSGIDFDSLLDHITFGTFQVSLPPVFKHPSSSITTGGGESPPKKKGRFSNEPKSDDSKGRVLNDHQFEDFKLRQGEKWQKYVGAHISHRPTWNDSCGMCARWHIKGDCFQGCKNADSHVPKEEVPRDKELAMRKYVKKVRDD